MQNKSAVPQAHSMGCAVACVAAYCEITYQRALELFQQPHNAWTRGFYCEEIISALEKFGHQFSFEKFDSFQHTPKLLCPGVFIFVNPNLKYPMGHFLIRVKDGWMNPWINFPQMIPVKAAIQAEIPGEVSFILYPK